MKLYKHIPLDLLRIIIRKPGFNNEYVTIIGATQEECISKLKALLKDKISPWPDGKRTSVDVREAEGGKNGKSKTFSFYGLDPVEVKSIIENNLEYQT